jgi:hypothetical protein
MVPTERLADEPVMRIDELAPSPVSDLLGDARRGDDVGEQDGYQLGGRSCSAHGGRSLTHGTRGDNLRYACPDGGFFDPADACSAATGDPLPAGTTSRPNTGAWRRAIAVVVPGPGHLIARDGAGERDLLFRLDHANRDLIPVQPDRHGPFVTQVDRWICIVPTNPPLVGSIFIEKVPKSGNCSLPHVPSQTPTITSAPVGPVTGGVVTAGSVGPVAPSRWVPSRPR